MLVMSAPGRSVGSSSMDACSTAVEQAPMLAIVYRALCSREVEPTSDTDVDNAVEAQDAVEEERDDCDTSLVEAV